MKMLKILSSILVLLVTLALGASPMAVYTQTAQSDKESIYQNFNTNRRANPKEAYRIAQEYLKKYGSDADTNTGTIKEWVIAYEAVVGRVEGNASKPQTSVPASPTINITSTTMYAPFSEINGTTWQVKGEENGKKWATILSFSAGGRLQYENYAASGTSTLLKGTWRQIDSDIFGTLLGPDGNTTGTITGQALNGVIEGTLKWSDGAEWKFSLESDSVPNLRKVAESKRWPQIENKQDAQEIRDYLFAFPNSPYAPAAQKKLTDLVLNPPAKIPETPVNPGGASDPQAESKAWGAVAKSLSAADMQVYLSYFPNGSNSSKAREKMRSMDDAEWLSIEKTGGRKEFSQYVEKNPYGKYVSTAKERIALITEGESEWERMRGSKNIDDFKKFLAKYPFGKNADLAREIVNPPSVGSMKTNSIGMKFMYIPAGTFMMGADKGVEKPPHQVIISIGFWIGKYEVTQSQWELVMGNNPSQIRGCGGDCPVETVSWNDAKLFIEKLNEKNDGFVYSLPTEAEWEYAARGGTTSDYYGQLDDIAWYDKNSSSTTHPVGQKAANAFGLHDVYGNVSEWCEDIFKSNYKDLPTDGSANLTLGDRKYRVIRRVSWAYVTCCVNSMRRDGVKPDGRGTDLGFRVVARPR